MKVFEAFKNAANVIKVGKEVIEALGILLEDADHNGIPDVCDHLQAVVDLVVKQGKAHLEQAKKELAEVKEQLLKVRAKLEEVRKGK
ncbi:MAG: hypothetical protein JSS82_15505 [Bacteroidetes bacterium]|nr:hypothetical protein [Bacteroidota bacterium]